MAHTLALLALAVLSQLVILFLMLALAQVPDGFMTNLYCNGTSRTRQHEFATFAKLLRFLLLLLGNQLGLFLGLFLRSFLLLTELLTPAVHDEHVN